MITNLKPYPAYKDSGVPWLGKVPEHWEVRRLKTVSRLTYGDALPADLRRDGDVPVYGSNGRVGYHTTANTTAPCIIVGRKGSFGKVNFSRDPVFAIDTTFFIDNRCTSANLRWLYYLLNLLQLDEVTKDSAIPGLDREDAYRVLVTLPPLPEQTAIVRFLDYMDRRVRRVIRARQQQIKLLEEYKRALIHQAVTGQIDVRTGKPYPAYKDSGVEWLGKVPQHWEVKRLRESVVCCINGTWGDEANGVYDLVCIRVADFDYAKFGVSLRNLTMRSIIPSKRIGRMLSRGDLLLEKSGGGDQQPVGRIVRFDHNMDAVCSNFIARVVPGDGYNPAYLVYLHAILYAIGLNVRSIKQTTGIQNLDSRMYFGEIVAFPPLAEQAAIAEYLDSQTAKIDAAVAAVRRQIELLREFREKLIADVVTGKVDVREVAAQLPEEPPEEAEFDGAGETEAGEAEGEAPDETVGEAAFEEELEA